MPISSVQQLEALRTQLDELIEAVSSSQIDLPPLDESKPIGAALEPQHTRLSTFAASLRHVLAVIEGPRDVLNQAFALHVPSSMRVAIEAHVEETLREAGTPLGAKEIAKSSGINPEKLARILRLLSAHHIFREVEPAVFERNRRSAILDTGKSVADLRSDPDNAYANTNGLAALIAHTTEEAFKAASYMSDTLLDPARANSYDPADAPFASALGGQHLFAYFAENERLMKRFAASMQGLSNVSPEGETVGRVGFPWDKLERDAVVVDVGGGSGHLCVAIGNQVEHVSFVVQDRPEVIEKAAPEASLASNVPPLAVVTNPMALAPIRPVSEIVGFTRDVYLLRTIIHDWPDAEAVTILKHLAEAAGPESKLVIVESTLVELCPPNEFPPTSSMPYYFDLQMLTCVGSQERTELQYEELGGKAGWKLHRTWKTGAEGRDGSFRHYEFRLK
ncbi:hypothetical protein JCM16303_001854 [Sporobolomyces ruberrimus]